MKLTRKSTNYNRINKSSTNNEKKHRLYKFVKLGIISFIMLILLINFIVSISSTSDIYTDIKALPNNKVGVILGTSRYTSNNKPNLFFYNRIDAAIKLFKKKKIKFIIVSGDNSIKSYNEPRQMYNVLVKRGIPKDKIFLDYAGFRTLDSVVRTHKVFNQKKFTIISQKFHNQRALYIAKNKNIEAVAYNAESTGFAGTKVRLREIFARVKMFYDLYIINAQPKFLGDIIEVK